MFNNLMLSPEEDFAGFPYERVGKGVYTPGELRCRQPSCVECVCKAGKLER